MTLGLIALLGCGSGSGKRSDAGASGGNGGSTMASSVVGTGGGGGPGGRVGTGGSGGGGAAGGADAALDASSIPADATSPVGATCAPGASHLVSERSPLDSGTGEMAGNWMATD
ncbi:MAG: hypothetical protein JXP73_17225, partial [Deltaproteobacteria bacterium]|nr:hypothetical protein [Deltaproteobacteria bacterium]